ncbi:MAG: hypothetical protein ABIR26_03865 [Ramlibacter sp.]
MNISRRAGLLATLGWLAQGALAQSGAQAAPSSVVFSGEWTDALRAQAQDWVARSAQVVTAYFGRFPAPQAIVTLVAADGAGVRGGVTYDGPPPRIRVNVGRDTSAQHFLNDWVMVHEMVHLGISQMPRRYSWFHEGAAVYVEIIARARAGLTSAESAWDQMVRNLHHGLPLAGEEGMDGARRWGRTYWGGALFFLQADLEIRRRTGNRLGLQDALGGLVRAGSDYGQEWPIERTLEAADSAVGVPVLAQMYARVNDTAVAADLPKLFSDLGLDSSGGVLRLLADAPLAGARRAILPEAV